jgi:hypothetical protein
MACGKFGMSLQDVVAGFDDDFEIPDDCVLGFEVFYESCFG